MKNHDCASQYLFRRFGLQRCNLDRYRLGGVRMNPYIGDRQLDPDEDNECEELPCGSHVYTMHGFCMHCSYQIDDSDFQSDPGEPNDYPEEP